MNIYNVNNYDIMLILKCFHFNFFDQSNLTNVELNIYIYIYIYILKVDIQF